jgi:Trk K+ transport system NAD-binding subunit
MRKTALILSLTLPTLALATEAPKLEDCMVLPEGAQVLRAEEGAEGGEFKRHFVLDVPDRLTAFAAVRDEVKKRFEATPYDVTEKGDRIIFTCEGDFLAVFQAEQKAGPGEVSYFLIEWQ